MLMLTALFAAASTCLSPPVGAPIARPFVAPACDYCPGQRGVEYDLAERTTVRAAAPGRVTFSGRVAGTVYVVVQHADGIRATYGTLHSAAVRSGDAVARGDIIGLSANSLYFGLRSGDEPVDPAPWLGRALHRPRLVPTDGSLGRPAKPGRLTCVAVAATPNFGR